MTKDLPERETYERWLDAVAKDHAFFVPSVTEEQLRQVHADLDDIVSCPFDLDELTMVSIALIPTAATS